MFSVFQASSLRKSSPFIPSQAGGIAQATGSLVTSGDFATAAAVSYLAFPLEQTLP